MDADCYHFVSTELLFKLLDYLVSGRTVHAVLAGEVLKQDGSFGNNRLAQYVAVIFGHVIA